MHVRRVSDWHELTALRPQWNRLAGGVAFRTWEWQATWWRHYGAMDGQAHRRRELAILCVTDSSGSLVGLAPWWLDRFTPRGAVLRFLGGGEVCSDHLGLLCRPRCEVEVATALAEWLYEHRPASRQSKNDGLHWHLLELLAVDAGDRCIQRLADELVLRGAAVYDRRGPDCWRIHLPSDWESYLALLSKTFRKRLRQAQRRMFDTGRAVLHTVRDPSQLGRGLRILTYLHQRRWQSLGYPGCFASDRFAAFHHEVASLLLDTGRLRLSWLEVDARRVAAEYQFAGSDTLYAYQSGIEPGALTYHPGRLAMMATLRGAIDEGRRAFDLLRGDEAYKATWAARPTTSIELRVLPGRPADWIRRGVWATRDNLRTWLRARWKGAADQAVHPFELDAPHALDPSASSAAT